MGLPVELVYVIEAALDPVTFCHVCPIPKTVAFNPACVTPTVDNAPAWASAGVPNLLTPSSVVDATRTFVKSTSASGTVIVLFAVGSTTEIDVLLPPGMAPSSASGTAPFRTVADRSTTPVKVLTPGNVLLPAIVSSPVSPAAPSVVRTAAASLAANNPRMKEVIGDNAAMPAPVQYAILSVVVASAPRAIRLALDSDSCSAMFVSPATK